MIQYDARREGKKKVKMTRKVEKHELRRDKRDEKREGETIQKKTGQERRQAERRNNNKSKEET